MPFIRMRVLSTWIFARMVRAFYSLTMTSIQMLRPLLRLKSTINAKNNIMAFEAMKQMKLYDATEMYTTMWIFITNFYRMGIGITAPVESKWEYLLCSSYKLYKLRLVSPFSTRMPLWTPSLLGETSNSKASQKRSVHIGNTGSVKHAWTSSKNGQNFAVVIIKKLYLTKTSGFDW